MQYFTAFIIGVFTINGLPHFIQGICGNRFQTPFASPPTTGESSPLVNVLWGAANFAIAYALFFYMELSLTSHYHTLFFVAGTFLCAIILSIQFDKARNGK